MHFYLSIVEHYQVLIILQDLGKDIVVMNCLCITTLLHLPKISYCLFQFLQLL